MGGKWVSFNNMTERHEYLYVKKQHKEIFEQSWNYTTDFLQGIKENS